MEARTYEGRSQEVVRRDVGSKGWETPRRG